LRQLKALLSTSIQYMKQQLSIVWIGLLIIFFLLSLGFFLFKRQKEEARLFMFPDAKTAVLEGEKRWLTNSGPLEDRIRMYVEDLVLGPMDLSHDRLVPLDTRVNSVLLRGDRVYIDFSSQFLFIEDEEIPLTFTEILTILHESVQINFRKVKDVVITINGEEPYDQGSDSQGLYDQGA